VLRVLVVAPTPFFGDRGCHVRIYEEVRALAARGVESEIVTYPVGSDPEGITVRRAPRLPGIGVRSVGPGYTRPIVDAALLGTALSTARRFRPHLIHAHLHEGIAIGAVLRRRLRVPLVADLQGSLVGELVDHQFLSTGSLSASVVARVERWLVRQPDVILASSSAALSLLEAQGADRSRLVWFPDGADFSRFRPVATDPALVSTFGLDGKRTVVFLGLLTPYQGVDLLIDAVPDVMRAVPSAHFLVMGYPDEEKYRAMVQTRGLAAHVTFPGRIPYADAARYLSLGQVAVSPKLSTTEANGKLLNYMACGLPIVASDTPVNRELLGDAGVYVPVNDAPALAAALAALLMDDERRARLGSALRQRVEAEFSWPALADRLVGIYEDVQRRTAGRATSPDPVSPA
jgi:glycosyltransferase involved in cell wall biosynthesis